MTRGGRKDLLALAAIGAAAALVIAWLIVRAPHASRDPLAAVPEDSFLVVSIDVWALAESPLGEAIVGRRDAGAGAGTSGGVSSLLGVDSIEATCGFEPLAHLRRIAIAIPEGGERGDFGLAATGDLGKEALASCARSVIAKRGGRAASREAGTFTVVSDASVASGAEVAFRDGGPFLVGRGAWLARMIDAAEGRAPTIAASAEHRALRAEIATRDADAEAIVASAILPRALRDRIRREMSGEGEAGEGGQGGDKGNAAMDGVLAVSSAGLAVHAGRADEDTRVVAELHCDTEGACAAVETLLLHARLGWSGDLRVRLFGLGQLVDGLTVQRQGTRLFASTRASAGDLAHVLDRALHPPARARPPPGAPAPAAPPSKPDEIVSAPRTDAGSR